MTTKDRPLSFKAEFEKGFNPKTWINANSLDLPKELNYIGYEDFRGSFGDSIKYTFENELGEEVRLLCKGATFFRVVNEYLKPGDLVTLNKNEKGYWYLE